MIDFKTCSKVLPYVIAVKKPILLRGRHGIGKSELVYQIAEKVGLPVVERRVSVMTEGDLVGLPVIKGDVTKFNPPDWFKQACDEPVVLFLDEVDRGTAEVAQQIFELTDSRKLNGNTLHPETLIFAAVNGGTDDSGDYQVREMDLAELDRWTVFDVEPTVEDWLEWAHGRIPKVVHDFIAHNNTHLEHKGEKTPGMVYPSRRSMVRFAECLEVGNLHKPKKSNVAEQKPIVLHLASGFLGFATAVAFADFYENWDDIITAKQIIDGGEWKGTVDWQLNQHLALIEEMIQEKYFQSELDEGQLQNLGLYLIETNKKWSEAMMKLMFAISSGSDDQNVSAQNFLKLGAIKNEDGATIADIISESMMERK